MIYSTVQKIRIGAGNVGVLTVVLMTPVLPIGKSMEYADHQTEEPIPQHHQQIVAME